MTLARFQVDGHLALDGSSRRPRAPRTILIGTLAVAATLLASACGEDLPKVDCKAQAVPKYSELTIIKTCTPCHASDKSGPARLNAPKDINLDTFEAAKKDAEESVAEVYEKKMPYPSGQGVTEADRQQFYLWGLCGTPN